MSYIKVQKTTLDQLVILGYTSYLLQLMPEDANYEVEPGGNPAMAMEFVPMTDDEFPSIRFAYIFLEMEGYVQYLDIHYLNGIIRH